MRLVIPVIAWIALLVLPGSGSLRAAEAEPPQTPPPIEPEPAELVEPLPLPPKVSTDVQPLGGPMLDPGRIDFPGTSTNPLRFPGTAFPAVGDSPPIAPGPPGVPSAIEVDRFPSPTPAVPEFPPPGGSLNKPLPARQSQTGEAGTTEATQPKPSAGTLLVWVVLGLGVSLGLAQRHRIVGHRRAVRRPWSPESRETILSIVDKGRHGSPSGDWLEIDSPW